MRIRRQSPCSAWSETLSFRTLRVARALLRGTEDTCQMTLHGFDPSRYSGRGSFMFKPLMLSIAVLAWGSVVPLAADARSEARTQVDFGINVAQRGLWREAIYRWERAVEIDPTYAAAYNDLAVAYEHEGQLDKARQAYEKALKLEPNNQQVRQNYELFKEINDRTSGSKERP